MNQLQNLLAGKYQPGLYYLQDKISLAEIRYRAKIENFYFYYLDAHNIYNKETLFDAAFTALNFPSDSGRNWDAFLDRLRDMPWESMNKNNGRLSLSIILFDHFETFAQQDAAGFALTLANFYSTIEFMREHNSQLSALYVLLQGDSQVIPFAEGVFVLPRNEIT